MSLARHWTPTWNISAGGTKRLLVIHTMEGFTGPNGAQDCAIYFQGDVGASSHVCIDNNRGHIWEGALREDGTWTQCQYNSVAISCEQSGYASWSRQYWLDNRDAQLHNIADWLAEEHAITGIPLVDISDPDGTGVIYHSELGSAGCGHADPGANWPLAEVLAWARGEGTSPAPIGDGDMTAAVVHWNNRPYRACVGTDNRVYFRGPDDKGWAMVDENSNWKSGCGMSASQDGTLEIIGVNQAGHVVAYYRPSGKNDWHWLDLGGNAR